MFNQLILIVICMASLGLFAADIRYGDNPVSVPLKLGKMTYLRFPTEVVEYPQNRDFPIEHIRNGGKNDYSVIKITALNASSVLNGTIVLDDKTFIKVNFYVDQTNTVTDYSYKFAPAKKASTLRESEDLSAIGLYKTMLRQNNAKEYKVLNLVVPIKSTLKDVSVKVMRSYRGINQNGFIVFIKNNSSKKILINIPKSIVGLPNIARFASTNKEQLEVGEATLAFFVTKSTGRPKDIAVKLEQL